MNSRSQTPSSSVMKNRAEDCVPLTRRAFVTKSALAFGAVALCGCSPRKTASGKGRPMEDYYLSRKKKLLDGFDGMRKYITPLVASSHPDSFINTLNEDARRQFETLIPEIPYVGGDENDLTHEMIQSAMALALYRAMQNHGRSVQETGELLYKTVEAMVHSYPRLLTRAIGFYQMSGFAQRKVKKASQNSQKRTYPANWVFDFIEGDGKNFDWGIDYTECGIVKFFHVQGADELTPYLCLGDFPMSEAFGMGLVRTVTIAEGAERCDFRFKRGRETEKGWPPKALKS